MKMKTGRSSYDCGDVSVTTARTTRSKNLHKKAHDMGEIKLNDRTCSVFSWQDNLMVSTHFLSLWSSR